MAVRQANVKGIKFLEEPMGADKGGIALVSFDLVGVVYTATADTVKLGGGGQDAGVASTDTLAAMIQKRRRDGKTITLTSVCQGPVPGAQAAATNGPNLYPRAAAVNTGNVDSITLFSAPTAGSECTTTTAAWDRAATLTVAYIAS